MHTHSLALVVAQSHFVHWCRYVEVMTPLRFRDHALIEGNDFYFRQAVDSSNSSVMLFPLKCQMLGR